MTPHSDIPFFCSYKKMNIMRKWWGSGGRVGGMEGGDTANSQAAQQHLALGLMHLKKLFSEYSYPPHPLSEPEKEDKLYNMLPLFCKVGVRACVSVHVRLCACACVYMCDCEIYFMHMYTSTKSYAKTLSMNTLAKL